MIIDASAIIAILRNKPDAAFFARKIANATNRRISAVNFVEAAVIIDASVILLQVDASMISSERQASPSSP